jgi:tRNA nucleotidyltransferase (CCA-adding enzyme)
MDEQPYPQAIKLQGALDIALGVDTAKVAKKCMETGKQGPAVGKAIQDARVTAIEIAWAASRAMPGP